MRVNPLRRHSSESWKPFDVRPRSRNAGSNRFQLSLE
jgi:hypothetical protein